MDKIMMLLPVILCLAVVTVSFALYPYISRKTLSFGISIPEGAFSDPAVAAIRSEYLKRIIITGIVLFAATSAVSLLAGFPAAALLPLVAVFAHLLVFSTIYLDAYKKTKQLKTERTEWVDSGPQLITADTGYRKRKPAFNPLWFGLYLLEFLATVMISLLSYDSLPGKLALRFDEAGRALTLVDKSFKVLMFMPLTQVFVSVLFILCFFMMSRSRLQIDPANREKTLEQNLRYRFRWSVLFTALGFILNALFGLIQLSIMNMIPASWMGGSVLVFVGAMIVSIIGMSVLSGQSGNRIKVRTEKTAIPIIRDDDRYWKWGVFYNNPDDPSLFIEKRMGIGWTINWGRPAAWFVVLGLLAFIAGFTLFTSALAK